MRQATLCLVCTAVLLLLLVSHYWGGAPHETENLRIRQLTEMNAVLQRQIEVYEARLSAKQVIAQSVEKAHCDDDKASAGGGHESSNATDGPSTAVRSNTGSALAQELLALHAHWDWQSIAYEMLQPFAYIDQEMLANGVRACNENGTMYCMRAQVRACLLP